MGIVIIIYVEYVVVNVNIDLCMFLLLIWTNVFYYSYFELIYVIIVNINLKIPEIGTISMDILRFEEFYFTHDFTALWVWKIEEIVHISK